MGCEICGSKVKDPTSSSHVNSKKHQKALNNGSSSITKTQNVSKNKKQQNGFEQRLSKLEEQMKYVLVTLKKIEQYYQSSSSPIPSDTINYQEVRNSIIQILRKRGTITLDQLINSVPYSWQILERVLKQMINDEIIDGADGPSSHKLYNRYGRIIRR